MARKKRLLTLEEVRNDFDSKGISIASWARKNNIRPGVVYEILSGRLPGKRGEAHRAAVLLGLKEGVIEKSA